MPRNARIAAGCLSGVALATLCGCVADRPTEETYGKIMGAAPLPALTMDHVDEPFPVARPQANILDRSDWEPIALLVPSDLTLHTPHYAPSRLPTTGDWRYDGTLPTLVNVYQYGSSNKHQVKSLAIEPFLQVYDLVMIPVRMFTQRPPNRLDASPDTSYVREPDAWRTELPATGRPIGEVGGIVISNPAESREL